MEQVIKSKIMKKVSFDFDGTLEIEHVQKYARELIERGFEVWVVTSRFGDNKKYQKFFNTTTNVDLTNKDLRKITEKIGISEERLVFTNLRDKFEFFEKNKDFLWHLDDDWIESDLLDRHTKVKGVSFFGNPDGRLRIAGVTYSHDFLYDSAFLRVIKNFAHHMLIRNGDFHAVFVG